MNYLKVLIIGMLFTSLILAGCAQQQDTDTDMPADEEPGVDVEPEPQVQTIEVGLSEFGITLSESTVEAGTVKFEVANDGNWRHEFAIEGPGVAKQVEGGIPSGESRNLEAELQAGTYKVYCPIPGHEEKGMVAEIVVE